MIHGKRITAGADSILKSIEHLSESEGKTAITLAIMAIIAGTSDSIDERMQQIRALCTILQSNLQDEEGGRTLQ